MQLKSYIGLWQKAIRKLWQYSASACIIVIACTHLRAARNVLHAQSNQVESAFFVLQMTITGSEQRTVYELYRNAARNGRYILHTVYFYGPNALR